MNTRSLKFRLTTWYAAWLACGFVLLGGISYMALRTFMLGALKDAQVRRVLQIQELVRVASARGEMAQIGEAIERWYEPEANDRFVRVTQRDGKLIYVSAEPRSRSFDPREIGQPQWPKAGKYHERVQLRNRGEILLTGAAGSLTGGQQFLVEAGAPLDVINRDLRHWLLFLVLSLPLAAVIAVAGGYLLITRALSPVDQIASSAERITLHNLGERLPVAKTGDELERLSSALNHMIERLDEALKYSRRFVADASHELRTPLTVLRGELEGFAAEPRPSRDWRRRIESALEEVIRLSSIVEGLFAISRLDAGEAAAEWVKFDLARLAAATADQMLLLAEDKKIRMVCSARQPVWVEGDRARLKQVVVNLLDNAIKYTPTGGAVGLTVGCENKHAVLEVADNGIGISPEALTRIFDRFYRVDKARSRELGGAGLGLSIVKSICTAHCGVVRASSEPGHGSRFRVELPLCGPELNYTGRVMNNHDN